MVRPEKNRVHNEWVRKVIRHFREKDQDYVILEEPTLPKFKGKGWHKPDILVLEPQGKNLMVSMVCEVNYQNPYEDPDEKPEESYQCVHTKLIKIRDSFGGNIPIVIFEPVKQLDRSNLNDKKKAEYVKQFNKKASEITSYSQIQQLFKIKWEKEGLKAFEFWTEKH